MPALFPNSIRIFSGKVDLIDTILADHVNLLQDEVTAIESTIGTGSLTSSWSGTYSNPSTHASLTSRLLNIEAGLKSLESSKLGATSNAATASAWQTPRTLTVSGAVSGSATIDGSANVTINTTSDATLKTTLTAKGDIYVASAASTPARLGVGANNSIPVADSAETVGIRWATSLSGLTLNSPVISTISNTGTLTLPTSTDTLVGRATTDTLTNKTLTTPVLNRPHLVTPTEPSTLNEASGATGTIQYDLITHSLLAYTNVNAAGNFSVNFRGNSSTSLASMLPSSEAGKTITAVLSVKNGTTPYYLTDVSIDGTAVTPLWQGGVTPTAGNASSVDVYSFTITATPGRTSAYQVLASVTRYA